MTKKHLDRLSFRLAVHVVEGQFDAAFFRKSHEFLSELWAKRLARLKVRYVPLRTADAAGQDLLGYSETITNGFQVVHAADYQRRFSLRQQSR
ncbi:hypothetical protein A9977_14550 [Variovorax sp. UMC13]|nr:hypothetical protein [Variovorax sp. UMC13]